MKRLTLHLAVALLTFFAGSSLWWANKSGRLESGLQSRAGQIEFHAKYLWLEGVTKPSMHKFGCDAPETASRGQRQQLCLQLQSQLDFMRQLDTLQSRSE